MQTYSRPPLTSSPQGYELERVTVSNRVVIRKSTESSEYYEDGDGDDDDEEAVEEQT